MATDLSVSTSSGYARAPAALERVPSPRAGQFSQILNNASNDVPKPPPKPAAATLIPLQPIRPTTFMHNSNIQQQGPVVQDDNFEPAPAALERMPGKGRVLKNQ